MPENMEHAAQADNTCLLTEGILRIMELTEMLAKENKCGMKINIKNRNYESYKEARTMPKP